MRVLVIAPRHPDLPGVDQEVAELVRWHECTLVQGEVRDEDIVRAIGASDGDYDVIWWATHGSGAGVQLSGGLLPTSAVVQYVIASGARLCVLSTCESMVPALEILENTRADVVATVTAVTDRVATRTAMLLARELAQSPSVAEAYRRSRPPDDQNRYIYLMNQHSNRNARMANGNGYTVLREYTDMSINALREEIEEIRSTLRTIVLMLYVIGGVNIAMALALLLMVR